MERFTFFKEVQARFLLQIGHDKQIGLLKYNKLLNCSILHHPSEQCIRVRVGGSVRSKENDKGYGQCQGDDRV